MAKLADRLRDIPLGFSIHSSYLTNFQQHPWGFVFPLLGLFGLGGMGYFTLRKGDLGAFCSSSAYFIVIYRLFRGKAPPWDRRHSLAGNISPSHRD